LRFFCQESRPYDPAVLLVGLTGGIGSGKSTVADLLVRRGAVIIDADQVAREVVEPGTDALAQLVERFGAGIIDADGRLDRPALAKIAFADEQSRKDLEAITHPAVNAEFVKRMSEAPKDAIVIMDVPLLVESTTARSRPYELVIVVEAPREIRLERLEQRGVARDDAERRMAAQATDEQRREVATFVLDNSGDVAHLERQVDELWADLERLAEEKARSTRVSRQIRAPRSAVYAALVDPDAIARWRFPQGMTCEVHELDASEGGRFRVSLTYDADSGAGKTDSTTDTYHGHFAKLVANEQVVEVLEFETTDPDLQGEMTMTTTLTDTDDGTKVVVEHTGIPPGVSPEDNETGTRMALDNLAALLEGPQPPNK